MCGWGKKEGGREGGREGWVVPALPPTESEGRGLQRREGGTAPVWVFGRGLAMH